MYGLEELCINNVSPLSFYHHLSTLLSATSFPLFDLSSSLLFSLIHFPCRG